MDCIGNLSRCQAACCKVLVFFLDKPTQDLIHYYELHNCKVDRMSRNVWRVLIPANCKALTQDNLCSLHGTEEKPKVCRRFDENHTEGYYIPEKCVLNPEQKSAEMNKTI